MLAGFTLMAVWILLSNRKSMVQYAQLRSKRMGAF